MKKIFLVISICELSIWKFQIDSIKIKAWVTHEKVEFLLTKEIPAGLNFIGINLKFSQIVDNYVTYNLYNFQIIGDIDVYNL